MFNQELRKAQIKRVSDRFKEHDFIHKLSSELLQESVISFPGDSCMLKGYFPELLSVISKRNIIQLQEFEDIEKSKFDVILLNLFLTFTNNLGGDILKYKECLKEKGILSASIFGNRTLVELRHVLSHTDLKVFNVHCNRMLPMYHAKTVTEILEKCGFKDVIVSVVEYELFYDTLLSILHDIRYSGSGNCLINSENNISLTKEYLKEAETLYKRLASFNNKLKVSVDLIMITAKL